MRTGGFPTKGKSVNFSNLISSLWPTKHGKTIVQLKCFELGCQMGPSPSSP